ncbi:MAG: MerR family transcriptional regulator [Pseudomonadota bacterium]
MARLKLLSVGEVARISGVSVRSLHHYDEIDLLSPATRSESGRRLYDSDSLQRLHTILVHRAMGLPLSDIRRLLEDPDFDRRTALIKQRDGLKKAIKEHEALVASIDRALAEIENPNPKEMAMADLFDGFEAKALEKEARDRWGSTDIWSIAQDRTKAYSPKEWETYKGENAAALDDLADAMRSGREFDHPEARSAIEGYRDLIDRWFYPCDAEHLGRLAALYEADPRYQVSFDKHTEGLAAYVITVFQAFADASAKDTP